MAQSSRENSVSELIYQGPLIGMREAKPKEEQDTNAARKPVTSEKRLPRGK